MHERRRQPRSRGISLVELGAVVAISSIIVAIAIPTFARPTSRQRLNLAGQRVAAELRYAATLSRASGIARTVTIDPNLRTLTITPAVSGERAMDLSAWPFQITSVNANFSNSSAVSFDIWGRPLSSGTVTLTLGKTTRLVVTNSVTGEVTVQ